VGGIWGFVEGFFAGGAGANTSEFGVGVEELDKAFADDAVVFNDADFGHRGIEQEVTERTEEIKGRGAKAKRWRQKDKKVKSLMAKS